VIAREAQMKHEHAFRPVSDSETELAVGGNYAYRVDGERHLLNPFTISKLQHAVRQKSFETFQEYSDYIDNQNEKLCNLRGLLRFRKSAKPVPIESNQPQRSSAASPPERCPSVPSARKPTRRWRKR
jgi:glutamate synthase domain-containing protein 2